MPLEIAMMRSLKLVEGLKFVVFRGPLACSRKIKIQTTFVYLQQLALTAYPDEFKDKRDHLVFPVF